MKWLGVIAVAAAMSIAAPATAQTDLTTRHDDAMTFVVNNTLHVLFHEFGHLLVDQYDLPVLGKEEDAVDMLATLMLIEEDLPQSDMALVDAVDGWLYSERVQPARGYANSDFYGEHSLDIQRSFTIACLMVQKSCEEDFGLARRSWNQVLAPYLRNGGSAGARVSFAYRTAEPEHATIARALRNQSVLERTAQRIIGEYVLPNPVFMTAESCGEVNAFYDPNARQVILCYEWAQFFYDLFVEHIQPVRQQMAMVRATKLEKLSAIQLN
jgi:hypothetical protein